MFSQGAVAKAVKCDLTTVKYWLKKSKDLSDSIRSDQTRGTTLKQDKQIVSLAKQQKFVTVRDISNKSTKTGATVNERTALEQSSSHTQSIFIKVIVFTEVHRKNCLK